jgi:hypothetical protein
MGLKVDQIATKSDLLKAGYFDITTNINDKECATYADIRNLVNTGKVASSVEKWNTINPTIHLSNTTTTNTLVAGNYVSFKIATYSLPTSFGSSRNAFSFDAANSSYVGIRTNSTTNIDIEAYFIFCPGSQEPTASSDGCILKSEHTTLNSSTKTMYMEFPNTASILWPDFTTASLYFVVANLSTTNRTLYANFGYTSASYLPLSWIPLYKCVKYSDAVNQIIRKPFYVGINEQVGGKTSANKIEVRYNYKTSSSATETYVTALSQTLNDPDNANGTFSMASHLECNARKFITSVPYSARMTIYCGSTSGNQSWSYRIRLSDNTWTSWVTLAKRTYALVDPLVDFTTLKTKGIFATLLSGSGENDWLKAASNITGVEFKID